MLLASTSLSLVCSTAGKETYAKDPLQGLENLLQVKLSAIFARVQTLVRISLPRLLLVSEPGTLRKAIVRREGVLLT